MEMRTLGRTGVQVSPLTLGAMMFGAWGNPDHDESIQVVHAALDAGINVIDTADVYAAGESEEIVGAIIGPRTMEHLTSQLGAVDLVLTDDVLDRIDEIVPPGTNFSSADAGYSPPSLTENGLRRR